MNESKEMEIYALRALSMGMFPLSCMLMIIHATVRHGHIAAIAWVAPFLAIIPTGLGATFAIWLNHTKKGLKYRDSELHLQFLLLLLIDSILLLTTVLICVVNIIAFVSFRPNTYVISTYVTFPLLENTIVHATFCLRRGALLLSKQQWPGQTMRCADCGGLNWNTEVGYGQTKPSDRSRSRRWEEYDPQQQRTRYRDAKDDGRIRLSEDDDEAAALIGAYPQETGVARDNTANEAGEGA